MAAPYQPKLNPSGSSDFGGAPAGGLAAPIAQALEYGGELVDHEIHRRKELDRDMQATAAGVQLAQASTAIDKAAIDARESAGPGGAGHSQNIDQMVDTQAQEALGSIRDPHVRAAFTARWAALKDQVSTREYGWEAGQRVNYLTTNVKDATDTYARAQASNPDLTALPNQLAAIHATIYSTSGIDDDTKQALAKEQQRAVVIGYAQAAIDKDPTDLVGDVKSGKPSILDNEAFNQYLKPEDIKLLHSAADVEIRRQAAEERQAFNLAKSQASEENSLFVDKIHSGYVPTDDEWAQHSVLAQKFGLGKDVWNIADLKDQADVNRQYRTATPVTLHQDINELQAKQAAGKTSQAENVRLNNLTAFAGPAIARFNSDPFAAAAAAGSPAPELGDLSNPDPHKVQARVAWARSFAASSGLVNVPYLSNDEQKIFTDRMKQGPAGQLEATATLRHAFGGTIAAQVVKQLAPGNKDVELMVGFHPRVAELYRTGAAALAGKTVHLGSTKDQQTGQDDREAMNDQFNAIADAVPAELQPAVRAAAENIAAGIAAEQGHHEPSGEALAFAFNSGLQRAGGRLGVVSDFNAPGGFAKVNDRYVWLPKTMSSNQALTRLSRAGKEDWTKAGGGAPYYLGSDGKPTPLTDGQLSQLNKYQLELYVDPASRAAVPGIYTLIGPGGGHVVQKDGSAWRFDIRNLR